MVLLLSALATLTSLCLYCVQKQRQMLIGINSTQLSPLCKQDCNLMHRKPHVNHNDVIYTTLWQIFHKLSFSGLILKNKMGSFLSYFNPVMMFHALILTRSSAAPIPGLVWVLVDCKKNKISLEAQTGSKWTNRLPTAPSLFSTRPTFQSTVTHQET